MAFTFHIISPDVITDLLYLLPPSRFHFTHCLHCIFHFCWSLDLILQNSNSFPSLHNFLISLLLKLEEYINIYDIWNFHCRLLQNVLDTFYFILCFHHKFHFIYWFHSKFNSMKFFHCDFQYFCCFHLFFISTAILISDFICHLRSHFLFHLLVILHCRFHYICALKFHHICCSVSISDFI